MNSLKPLECIICYEVFNSVERRPCVGQCGHSICEQCRKSISSSRCPQCNRQNAFLFPTINYQLMELSRFVVESNCQTSSSSEEENEGFCMRCGAARKHIRICVKCAIERNVLVRGGGSKLYINWKAGSIDEAVERVKSSAICADCSFEEHSGHETVLFSTFEKDLQRFATLEKRMVDAIKIPEKVIEDLGNGFQELCTGLKYLHSLSKSVAPDEMNRHYKHLNSHLNDLSAANGNLLDGLQKLMNTMHNMKRESEHLERLGTVLNRTETSLAKLEPILMIDRKQKSNEPLVVGILDPQINNWTNFGSSQNPKSNYAVALNGPIAYTVGGDANGSYLADVELFDGLSKYRRLLKKMNIARSRAAATFHNGQLYVCGGFNGAYTKKVEIYNPETKEWQVGPDMLFERADCRLVSFDGELFVLGGVNSFDYVRKIEKLNERDMKFEICGDMCGTRAGFGACVFDGRIYIAGGWGSEERVSGHCRSFEPVRRVWREEPSMNRHRIFFDLYATDEAMYAIRGRTHNWDLIEDFERFDKTTGTWTTIPCVAQNQELVD